jgi:signal transduction histidine kinase
VQTTIDAVRELAHGIYPPLLRDRGLGEALQTAADRCPLPVMVDVQTTARYPADAEAAIYFCCLEAMQNAGKHAGADASITITVAPADGQLCFSVRDDGRGFDPSTLIGGHGFTNMTDRLGAMGGSADVDSTPGAGTCVSGWLPSAPVDVTAPAAESAHQG